MKRCAKCILPETYPEITFNEKGICNYCTTHKAQQYLGDEALKERIQSFLQTRGDRNRSYDCVLAFSGGRDSTYLLYYLVRILRLRVLVYSIDNGFCPEQTRLNMEKAAATLNVKLVVEKDENLKTCIRHHVLSFIHRPSPAMIGLLCTGCRLALDTRIPNFARKQKVPVIIGGSNPLDVRSYKEKLMTFTPNGKQVPFVLGYLLQVMQNPMWILSFTCLATQIKEYYYHFYLRGKGKEKDLLSIAPFYRYVRWEEKEVVSTIENELNWRKHSDIESTWRGDCDVVLLKLYMYKKMLGYNDKDEGLSYLIRDGQISREEALKRLEKEGNIPDYVVKQILDKLGLDFSSLKGALTEL